MPKPFLTPPSTPIERQCRTLKMPPSKEWLGIFNSALYELLNEYNWEQVNTTDLTIEQAIAECEVILAEFFASTLCGDGEQCYLPEGVPAFRLNSSGHIQELFPEGWGEPTGDSTIPPVPAREEPTASERRCLAAANAAHVLKLVYEEVTDAVNEELDEAEIEAAFVAIVLTLIGAWLALPIIALIALAAALFRAFIEIAEFMTIDLWDSDFEDILRCLLYECATDTAGVVTFDMQCFLDNYAATVNLLHVDALDHLRLYGQIAFMLQVIGVDGLNAAGATTAITVATCDCGVEWCAEFVFSIEQYDWTVAEGYESVVSFVSGVGFKPTNTATSGLIAARLEFPSTQHIISVGVEIDVPMTGNLKRTYYAPNGSIFTGENSNFALMGSSLIYAWDTFEGDYDWIEVGFQNGSPNSSHPKNFALVRVVINGFGTNPYPELACGE